MFVVAEILRYPVVDGGQSHFGLFAGLHGHADERGVGIGRFDLRVGFVIDLHGRARLDVDLRVGVPWMCVIGKTRCRGAVAAGGDGAPEVQRHPGGGGVPGRRAGRGVGSPSGKAEPLQKLAVLGGGAAGSGSVGPLRVRVEDGEVLEPVEAGEAVVQGRAVGPGDRILRVHREPFLLKLVRNVGARENRHRGSVRVMSDEDGRRIVKSAFKVIYLEVIEMGKKEKRTYINHTLINHQRWKYL